MIGTARDPRWRGGWRISEGRGPRHYRPERKLTWSYCRSARKKHRKCPPVGGMSVPTVRQSDHTNTAWLCVADDTTVPFMTARYINRVQTWLYRTYRGSGFPLPAWKDPLKTSCH